MDATKERWLLILSRLVKKCDSAAVLRPLALRFDDRLAFPSSSSSIVSISLGVSIIVESCVEPGNAGGPRGPWGV